MEYILGGFMENAIINEKLFMKVHSQFSSGEKYILGKNGNFSFSELSPESHMGQIFTSSNQKQCDVKFVYIA